MVTVNGPDSFGWSTFDSGTKSRQVQLFRTSTTCIGTS